MPYRYMVAVFVSEMNETKRIAMYMRKNLNG